MEAGNQVLQDQDKEAAVAATVVVAVDVVAVGLEKKEDVDVAEPSS